MADWKELWLNNYKGVGDTAALEKHLKTLGYGARTNISYLPWAVVERIFRLQDGEVHWLPSSETSYVDADTVRLETTFDPETGEGSTKAIRSYFINIQATWQGREYTERYPLQDSNGRPLSQWTQNELNKAFQRGKVKAIAIVSGIGYKLFEDGDLQFEEEQEKPAPTPTPKPKATITPKPKAEKTLVVENEKSRLDYEQEIKKEYLGGEVKANIIKKFLVEKEAKKVSDLTDEEVQELHLLIQ